MPREGKPKGAPDEPEDLDDKFVWRDGDLVLVEPGEEEEAGGGEAEEPAGGKPERGS